MHSHLAIRHLIRHVEDRRNRRGLGRELPGWLTSSIDRLSDVFEPFSGVARVGYEAIQAGDRWEVSMFLGEQETVGGADDGRATAVNFRFDINAIYSLCDRVDSLCWNAFPNSHVVSEEDRFDTFLTLEAVIDGHAIALQVHALPPESVGPAMRQHADGRMELV
ncbi:MAG: hypothetical protein R3C01_06925 [Planctomycetaceae bacterium]